MTGYGKAETTISTGKITVEIRTLNAKNAEVNVKSSLLPRDKELAVRKKLADTLVRGTIDLFISFEPAAGTGSLPDTALLRSYLGELRDAIPSGIPSPVSDAVLVSAIMRLPEFTASVKKADTVPADEWPLVEKAIDEALAATEAYRLREGEALHADVTGRIGNILALYDEVEKSIRSGSQPSGRSFSKPLKNSARSLTRAASSRSSSTILRNMTSTKRRSASASTAVISSRPWKTIHAPARNWDS